MAEVILMPRLSDTMTEGVIAAWHKKVGDTVKKGDLLAEIETDKATMELDSYQNGVLLHTGAPVGGKLQVNDLLAILGQPGEDISGLLAQHAPNSGAQPAVKPAKAAPATPPDQPAANVPAPAMDISKMEEVVLMPRLSDTMTEGVIAAWHKNVGDTVKKGEVLADIETDKATMELESYKDGTLLYQGAKAGQKIQVNDLLCIIGKEGLDINGIIAAVKHTNQQSAAPAPAAPTTAAAAPASVPAAPAPTAAPVVVNEGRIFVSPLAKKLAEEKGIDLRYVKGSGDNGRIIKADIDNYVPATTAASATAAAAPTVQALPAGQVRYEDVPVSQMRKTIARRLSESLFTAPHFYLTMA
uniref:biotin/lipoyl-containing protein n=1 Tax=Hydrotalea flava TaxID=714549 RepID=UPI000AFDE780